MKNKGNLIVISGPSGTGKSYRAQMVANEYNINYIIDDGILIKENDIIAGSSAKKASANDSRKSFVRMG